MLEKSNVDIWHAIDVMRGWVIAGMASSILILIGIIVQVAFAFAK